MKQPDYSRDKRCRNCGRSLYFGGLYWWHRHNESGFCEVWGTGTSEADPFADEGANLLSAARELLEALKIARKRMAHSNRKCLRLLPTEEWTIEKGNRDEHCECEIAVVDAAIAKAEGTKQ
jgi:hypothetical protein